MGSSISSIVNKQQGDLKAQAQDQLNDTSDSTLIPVDKILVMDYQVKAGVTSNADNIKTVITNTSKVFGNPSSDTFGPILSSGTLGSGTFGSILGPVLSSGTSVFRPVHSSTFLGPNTLDSLPVLSLALAR
ncbi:hypothetical protein B0H14DRAFT_3453553 [Mycena olivaceomarginata]|nr:hypothetical protein B0H14DRAFT_3453553 [Mycena olivaceomarginata]